MLGFLSALKIIRSSLPQPSPLLLVGCFAKPRYLARKKASGFQMDWTPFAFPVGNSAVVGEKKKKREIPWQDLSKTSSKLAVANSAHASVLFSQGMAMLRKDHEIPSTCARYYFTFCFHGGKCVPQSSQRREKPSAADRGVCVSTHQHRLL